MASAMGISAYPPRQGRQSLVPESPHSFDLTSPINRPASFQQLSQCPPAKIGERIFNNLDFSTLSIALKPNVREKNLYQPRRTTCAPLLNADCCLLNASYSLDNLSQPHSAAQVTSNSFIFLIFTDNPFAFNKTIAINPRKSLIMLINTLKKIGGFQSALLTIQSSLNYPVIYRRPAEPSAQPRPSSHGRIPSDAPHRPLAPPPTHHRSLPSPPNGRRVEKISSF